MPDAPLARRRFLRHGLGAVTAVVGSAAIGCTPADPAPGRELLAPDANGVMLPAGFRSRVLARSWEVVPGTGHLWHPAPDGGAVFPRGDGWIYVSNSESFPGGVGALEFDADGEVVAGRPILQDLTMSNCAGGATPWGTWLSCEEWEYGRVWECDPTGAALPQLRLALGVFAHEAVAADPVGRALYLTEDRPDSCLYRFVPARWGDLSAGRLSVAVVDEVGGVTWREVPDPAPKVFDPPTRRQVAGAARFNGGEGIVHDRGHVFFTTKGDNRVWDLDLAASRLSIRYEPGGPESALRGVDNITVDRDGGLYVAEDGGNMEIVLVDRAGRATPVLRVVGHPGSELTGPAFDPSGTRLYFSSQRGWDGRGVTYEVTGPFVA